MVSTVLGADTEIGSENRLKSRLPFWKVILASVTICVGSFSIGTVYAFPSPSFPQMNSEPNSFRLSSEEQSWAVSSVSFGGLIGGLSGRFLVDILGRKLSLILSLCPLSIGWLIILCSRWSWMVILGRIITGLAVGVTWVCSPIYVAEIAPTDHRGLLLMSHAFLLSVGVVWSYLIGQFLHWRWLIISYLIINIIAAIGLTFIPESPRWLTIKGWLKGAEDSLKWFRGVEDVQKEFFFIKANVQEQKGQKIEWKDICHREFYCPLMLTLASVTVQIWGGITIIDAYTVDIFTAGGSTIDPYTATTIIGFVQLFGNFYMFYVMNTAGRRPLLIISGIGLTISLVAMSIFFKVKEIDPQLANEKLFWLPIASIVLYFITFDIGWSCVPPAMIGELLPLRYRGLAGGITVAWAWTSIFLTTKFYVNIVQAIGLFGPFLIYAVVTVFGVVFAIFLLPETKNKTLEEIENLFRKKTTTS
ncbi:Facilitated trehalose transporter Tret1 [Chamberlinius hualienensis]